MAREERLVTALAILPRRRLPLALVFLLRLVKTKPLGAFGGVVLVLLVLMAIFADLIAPFPYDETNIPERLQSYSGRHWLGTDNLGRDVFSRVVYGARISMYVGLGAVGLGGFLAVVLGITSGYFGGWFDIVVQRLVDAWMSFPYLVILLSIMAAVGSIGANGLVTIILVLALGQVFGHSRVIRSAVLAVKENQYIEAAKAVGCSSVRIIASHVLPNVFAPIIILLTVGLGAVILAESSLSFLGFGVPPPHPSWGGMLSGQGRAYMFSAPWMALYPGIALSLAVYGFNMLGDALRDLLDPRLRGGGARMG